MYIDREKKPHQNRIFWYSVILCVFVFLGLASLSLGLKDTGIKMMLGDLDAPLLNLIATITLTGAALQTRKISKDQSIGWGLLACGQFCNFLGDVIWAVYELGLKTSPYPSFADVFYILFYPLCFAGIFFFSTSQLNKTEAFKRSLDIAIILLASGLVYWTLLIGPILQNSTSKTPVEIFLSVAYPVGDLIIFFGLIVIIFYQFDMVITNSLWLLALGLFVEIIVDSIYSYQSLNNIYYSGGTLDLGWILFYLLITLAGIYQVATPGLLYSKGHIAKEDGLAQNRVARGMNYLPYLWMLGIFVLLWFYHDKGNVINSAFLFSGVGSIIGFTIIRQIITINENDGLIKTVSEKINEVNRQAHELEDTNKNLRLEIAKRGMVEEKLSHDALHDGLTGLANRVLFLDRLEHAITVKHREPDLQYSILFINLDNFKSINDGWGHTLGDMVLVEVARRIKNCTKAIDTVSRFDGDEFVVLLENTIDPNIPILVEGRIRREPDRPLLLRGNELKLTCSVGIVLKIDDYVVSDEVLRDVQIAMDHAKSKGKNRSEVFTNDMRTSVLTRLELENDLRQAIVHNELFLNFQPIYSLDVNRLSGFEALVRWNHPLRGLIMPGDFIELAEETGFIVTLGDWVMREACMQLVKWKEQFASLDYLTMSVNVSGKQLTQPNFVSKVIDILQDTGLEAASLKLEITESAIVNNQAVVDKLLAELRDIGIAFMIDDFGTGYSSFAYLKNFSANFIKIDKSFVKDISNDKKASEIVRTIILMAQGMGIYTLAEGIEYADQLRILREMDCTLGQGYFLSRPMKAAQVENILESWNLFSQDNE